MKPTDCVSNSPQNLAAGLKSQRSPYRAVAPKTKGASMGWFHATDTPAGEDEVAPSSITPSGVTPSSFAPPTSAGPGITTLSFHGPQPHINVPQVTVPTVEPPSAEVHAPNADLPNAEVTPSVEIHASNADVPNADTNDCAPTSDTHVAVTADLMPTPGADDCGCGDQSSYPVDATASIAAHADVPAETGVALHLDLGGDTLLDVSGADVHVGTDSSHC
jgi:hypothetical protein